MRIADSTATLASGYSVSESYQTSVARETSLMSGDTTVAGSRAESGTEVNISEEGMNLLTQSSGKTTGTLMYSAGSVKSTDWSRFTLSSKEDLQLRLLSRLLEGLTGKKLQIQPLTRELTNKSGALWDASEQKNTGFIVGDNLSGNLLANRPVNRSVNTTTIESSYQREDRMQFAATAQVHTADGMTIDLAVNLSMSRSFASSQSISWSTEVQYCDPLVFNFNGRGVELLGETFSFDVDNDGTSDQISLLAEGNGFLALDINGDGVIGDGGELFGAKSGNGFADLAEHDLDGNGWIDENDDIFDKLKIMFTDKDGNQRLFALGELGIGAIYLGNAQSNFELRDESNEAQGKITHTGFFLYENGNAGLVQNVNFRMYDIPTNEPLLYEAAV